MLVGISGGRDATSTIVQVKRQKRVRTFDGDDIVDEEVIVVWQIYRHERWEDARALYI